MLKIKEVHGKDWMIGIEIKTCKIVFMNSFVDENLSFLMFSYLWMAVCI